MARPTGRPVRDELLTATRDLIQRVGVGGFSYHQLAEQLDIKAPSIHHHFRHKEDLVAEVARSYRADFAARVDAIDTATTIERLLSYRELFVTAASQELLCLCGAIAAEWATTGPAPRVQIEGFFDDQLSWLTAQIEHGMQTGELRADLDAAATARTLFATLEGALLLTRANPAAISVEHTSNVLISLLVAP